MDLAAELHPEPISEEEYFARPYTGQRDELIDGTLLTGPAPDARHQRVSSRLRRILDEALPASCEVFGPVNVRLAVGRIVVPDAVVLTTVGSDDLVAPAEAVLILVEIVSPSTEAIDRLLKPGLAAQAKIPYFWLVDPDGPSVTVQELFEGRYRTVATAAGDERISVTEPFPVDFRPAELLAPRRV